MATIIGYGEFLRIISLKKIEKSPIIGNAWIKFPIKRKMMA
jgi:hypothetical protein